MGYLLQDLPEDIVSIILSFLQPKDFLALCCSAKTFYAFRQDPVYWRTLTSVTFRLPVSPLLKGDGARWYFLYKRLKTQTRLYTWGQGLEGGLGPGRSRQLPRAPQLLHPLRGRIIRTGIGRNSPIRPRHTTFQRTSSSWPTETHLPEEIKVVADLQCGGWSTSILSSDGKLYVTGIINSIDRRHVGESTDQFQRLDYLTESTSAIKQFSAGRFHILALTDDGEIVSWDRINAKGLKVFSRQGRSFGGRPSRVVAGWAESSAYVAEIGIFYWSPVENDSQDEMLDSIHILEKTIPGTARNQAANNKTHEVIAHIVLEGFIVWINSLSELWACDIWTATSNQTTPSHRPFQVPGYSASTRVMQDIQGKYNKFAVFTDTGEILAGHIDHLRMCADAARINASVDDPTQTAPPSSWNNINNIIEAKPQDIQALQHNQVISLAFGDHHYHALHANGKITSYGHEPQSSGALALGTVRDGGRFRGLQWRGIPGISSDLQLIQKAENRGRCVWFEPEKRDWLRWMEETLQDRSILGDIRDAEGNARGPLFLWEFDENKQLMFSEWVEQEGKHWDDGPLTTETRAGKTGQTAQKTEKLPQPSSNKPLTSYRTEDDFHLDPYFAISVAAAGWHSGALVLVDDKKAHETRQKWLTTASHSKNNGHDSDHQEPEKSNSADDDYGPTHLMPGHFENNEVESAQRSDSTQLQPQHEDDEVYIWKTQGFPKIVLPDGYEMPGQGEERRWRDGKPSISELGLV